MTYRVEITAKAEAAFLREATYIAEDSGYQSRAVDWLKKAYALVDRLETFPERCPLAPENDHADYTVRKLIHGRHFILFIVDKGEQVVYVLNCRHGMRLPSEDD